MCVFLIFQAVILWIAEQNVVPKILRPVKKKQFALENEPNVQLVLQCLKALYVLREANVEAVNVCPIVKPRACNHACVISSQMLVIDVAGEILTLLASLSWIRLTIQIVSRMVHLATKAFVTRFENHSAEKKLVF
jgi:hypothetical protein